MRARRWVPVAWIRRGARTPYRLAFAIMVHGFMRQEDANCDATRPARCTFAVLLQSGSQWVQHPTSHLFKKSLGLKDYIALSGGVTYKADSKRIFVVKADGSVGDIRKSSWFPLGSSGILPGDTVVVPLDADRGQALKRVANITQVVYQMALATAAVNSF